MAIVVRQNKYDPGIGGHISTYASLATLLEVGFNHFFHAQYGDQPGDLIYFQGHASPGVYARAYLEGRLTDEHLKNFTRPASPTKRHNADSARPQGVCEVMARSVVQQGGD